MQGTSHAAASREGDQHEKPSQAEQMLAALKLVVDFNQTNAPSLIHLPCFKSTHEVVFAAIARAEGR